jgi:hypothetical protein
MTDRHERQRRRPLTTMAMLLALLALLLAGCSTGAGDDPTPTPTATITPSPTPSPTPTVTPSPTPYVQPTVAVTDDDTIQSCLERNITPELLISLSNDDTSLTEDIMKTCLETTLPSQLTFILNPVIEDASECALDVSKTLSNEELIALAGNNSARKDEITDQVVRDILGCLGDKYSFGIF